MDIMDLDFDFSVLQDRIMSAEAAFEDIEDYAVQGGRDKANIRIYICEACFRALKTDFDALYKNCMEALKGAQMK